MAPNNKENKMKVIATGAGFAGKLREKGESFIFSSEKKDKSGKLIPIKEIVEKASWLEPFTADLKKEIQRELDEEAGKLEGGEEEESEE